MDLEDLQHLFLQLVVPYNAHVQAFYAKCHLDLLSHEPNIVLVGPLIFTSLPLALQSLLHHLWSFPLAT